LSALPAAATWRLIVPTDAWWQQPLFAPGSAVAETAVGGGVGADVPPDYRVDGRQSILSANAVEPAAEAQVACRRRRTARSKGDRAAGDVIISRANCPAGRGPQVEGQQRPFPPAT
jgi:hypothetical protein